MEKTIAWSKITSKIKIKKARSRPKAVNGYLFENPGFGNHWLSIKLVGVTSNRAAIGARIHVEIEEGGVSRSIYRHVNSGGSFGANPLQQTMGLGVAKRVRKLSIFWPTTGRTQIFHDIGADQFIRIVEDENEFAKLELKTFKLGHSDPLPVPGSSQSPNLRPRIVPAEKKQLFLTGLSLLVRSSGISLTAAGPMLRWVDYPGR